MLKFKKKEVKVMMGFHVEPKIQKKILALAKKEGIPKSSVLEQIVENFFKEGGAA